MRLICCVYVTIGAVIGASVFHSDGALTEAIAEADRLDPGWRLEDILGRRARARMPDAINAALKVKEARRILLEDWPQEPHWLTVIHSTPIERRLHEDAALGLREQLKALAPAVTAARELARLPEGQTEYTTAGNPYTTPLPHVGECRMLQRLLTMDMADRLEADDAEGAVESVRAMLNVGRSIGDDPTLVSQLMRMAIDGLAVDALMRVLARCEPTEASLALLQGELLRERGEPRALYALRGERAMYFELLERLATGALSAEEVAEGHFQDDLAETLRRTANAQEFYRHNQAVGLRLMTRAVENAKRPLHEQGPFWEAWREELLGLRSNVLKGRANLMVSMFLSSPDEAGAADQRAAARLGCGAVAIAAERFRRERGRWPESQADMSPDFLNTPVVDPYDGKPMRIKPIDDGLVIYAVGRDGKDDSGAIDPLVSDIGVRLYDVGSRGRR